MPDSSRRVGVHINPEDYERTASMQPPENYDTVSNSSTKKQVRTTSSSNNTENLPIERIRLESPSENYHSELVSRHPTILRAGPQKTTRATTLSPTPLRYSHRLEEAPEFSFDSTPLSIIRKSSFEVSLLLDQELLALCLPNSSHPKRDGQFQSPKEMPQTKSLETGETNDVATPKSELESLKQQINTLFVQASDLLPPYLVDRLQRLELVENECDLLFDRHNTGSGASSGEQLTRLQQFLPVLKRMIDLASEMMEKEEQLAEDG